MDQNPIKTAYEKASDPRSEYISHEIHIDWPEALSIKVRVGDKETVGSHSLLGSRILLEAAQAIGEWTTTAKMTAIKESEA